MAGCSLNPPLDLVAASGGRQAVELTAVPFHGQQAHHCGPASLLTVLEASGVEVGYDAVVERVYVPGLEGSLQAEMTAAARTFGRVAYALPPDPAALLAEVAAGRPALVLLNLGLPSRPVWHYAVVVGFDPLAGTVVLRSGDRPRHPQKAGRWLRRWRWAGSWGLVLLRPGEWPALPDRSRLLRALAEFENAGDAAAAGLAWATAVERWPEETMAWLGLGNTAYAGGALPDAVAAYRRAAELDPERVVPRLNLAMALREAGDPCAGRDALGPAPPADHALLERHAALADELQGQCSPAP